MDTNRLQVLFDFQRFSPNKRLAEIIECVAQRYSIKEGIGIEISDEHLYLSAAGDPNVTNLLKETRDAKPDTE